MALTKRSESNTVFLEVKHYCLWRPLKEYEANCEELEVNNPSTGKTQKVWGYRFDTVTGRVTELVKYDTEQKYETRYFGFKLHFLDGSDRYVLTMPYHSQILRRFLRVAHNVNWNLPLSITIFKGKGGKGDKHETGVWFRQGGDTVKPYYTKEQPHGCPQATFDKDEQKWDFKLQHRWLLDRLQSETIPDIEAASARVAPPVQPEVTNIDDFQEPPDDSDAPPNQWSKDHLTDQDCPF